MCSLSVSGAEADRRSLEKRKCLAIEHVSGQSKTSETQISESLLVRQIYSNTMTKISADKQSRTSIFCDILTIVVVVVIVAAAAVVEKSAKECCKISFIREI